jgi:hypothetical protein
MSTHVIGIKPPDEKWRKMKKVWDACKEAGIEVPNEVWEYFECQAPDNLGVLVKILDSRAVLKYADESAEGYCVHIDLLPPDVKIVRFYNSW